MRAVVVAILFCVGCDAAVAAARNGVTSVGYISLEITDAARQRLLKTKVWYPASGTRATAATYDFSFLSHAEQDAEYEIAGRRPLIVMSHGDRGSNLDQSWLAEALASHGYIVAAVSHWKNTWNDHEPAETAKVWERPKDISFLLAELRQNAIWNSRIDWNRVGAAGHSSGGYTVLALAGAIYRPSQMPSYCASPRHGLDCSLVDQAVLQKIDFRPAQLSYRDERVRAVFAMAPALGPGLEEESLHAISIPLEIVASTDDEFLPFDLHGGRVAHDIPSARLKLLSAGGHFVFLSECTWVTKAFTYFSPFDICGRKSSVDRASVHEQVAAEALRFFGDTLASPTTAVESLSARR